jgi:hypothetical protein
MEKKYWLRRNKAAAAMARQATSAEARLIHLDLAGARDERPFLLLGEGPTSDGERSVLRLFN